VEKIREKERACKSGGCGRAAVARHDFCPEHLITAEIAAREAAERRELYIVASTAERKERRGQPLTPREIEVLQSRRVIEERFGGQYPPPTGRPGVVHMTQDGTIVDRRELSVHLRAKKSLKILENMFCDL
jgi:hypothetical protein